MFIVYKNPYTSYGVKQSGYFVRYKNKISDVFSENWYEAYKYKTLKPALNRLGIHGLNCNSVKDFIDLNSRTMKGKSIKRHLKINQLIGKDLTIEDIINYKGRIEFINGGKLEKYDIKKIIDFITKQIENNKEKIENNKEKINKQFKDLDINEYITKDVDSSNFWED